MKLLGIDYGLKRVGLAIADTSTGMAFPKKVLKNSANLINDIKNLCAEEKIDKIVLGESKDFAGKDNKIMEEINRFKTNLEAIVGLSVFFEPEFMTSQQATQIQGENKMLDASAAAIILQSYIDKKKNR